MNSLGLLAVSFFIFAAAYRLYGKYLSGIFELDSARRTPALVLQDGTDFVPAKNWWILFGHHFSSICGAGPIVGPVLACVYWGWGISLVWILIGAVWMGAVSDFSSLIMSVRDKGNSIAHVSGVEISSSVRLYFSIFLWISLILVIAVFSIFAAKTFIAEPDAVLPSVGLIPTAVVAGWLLYQKKVPNRYVTPLGILALAALLYAGLQFRISIPAVGGMDSETIWIFLLLIYCYVASVLPVNILLQPRDYLASFVLFAMILVSVLSVVWVRPEMQMQAFTAWQPEAWSAAGPLWPMLFVTIACGAISGFHAIVSSGTTSKQIADEIHCCRIGYGGMLLESLVGVLVLIAVASAFGQTDAGAMLRKDGPIAVFSAAYGNLSSVFLGEYGKGFAVLALNAFILTTLDTATRITRYITSEVFGLKNKYLATLIVVTASALLALSGKWNLLWPAFGAANQLIAGITLLIASCWLINRGKPYRLTLVPAFFMVVTTVAAFAYQFFQALLKQHEKNGWTPDWLMVFITFILVMVALSILKDTLRLVKQKTAQGR